MTKWEYLTIYLSTKDGRVEEVNGKPIRRKSEDEDGNLKVNEKYKLHDYLTLIGNEGWEVVTSVRAGIIAKRHQK